MSWSACPKAFIQSWMSGGRRVSVFDTAFLVYFLIERLLKDVSMNMSAFQFWFIQGIEVIILDNYNAQTFWMSGDFMKNLSFICVVLKSYLYKVVTFFNCFSQEAHIIHAHVQGFWRSGVLGALCTCLTFRHYFVDCIIMIMCLHSNVPVNFYVFVWPVIVGTTKIPKSSTFV